MRAATTRQVYRKPVGLVGPLLLGAPGSAVTIVIMRGDEQMDVHLQRRPANQVMSCLEHTC